MGDFARRQTPELIDFDNDNIVCNIKASDVYAFACVCYEILTGKVPFDKHTNAIARAIGNDLLPSYPLPSSAAWTQWTSTNDIILVRSLLAS